MVKKISCPEENRCCAFCERSEPVGMGDACICSLKGMVHGDGICRRFVFDLLKYKPHITKLPKGDMLDFNVD